LEIQGESLKIRIWSGNNFSVEKNALWNYCVLINAMEYSLISLKTKSYNRFKKLSPNYDLKITILGSGNSITGVHKQLKFSLFNFRYLIFLCPQRISNFIKSCDGHFRFCPKVADLALNNCQYLYFVMDRSW
jgi:hypothetical protein